MTQNKNTYKQFPDEKGYFGQFGGRYVSETLMPLILEVEKEYNKLKNDKDFINDFKYFMKNYVAPKRDADYCFLIRFAIS